MRRPRFGEIFWNDRREMPALRAYKPCRLGGSCANMLYRDTQGLYGEAGTIHMFNPESAEHNIFTGQALRRLPTFWMVKP